MKIQKPSKAFLLSLSLLLALTAPVLSVGMNFAPQVVPDPNMASYNAFWDGAVGSRGYWGSLPQPPNNVFSKTFDTKGFKSMYHLNSMSPFMSERVGDFDKMVPFYSPYSASMFTYMPTKSNHLTNKQLGAYSYDPNEPRYSKLYKQYFRFFNYNLDRICKAVGYIVYVCVWWGGCKGILG